MYITYVEALGFLHLPNPNPTPGLQQNKEKETLLA